MYIGKKKRYSLTEPDISVAPHPLCIKTWLHQAAPSLKHAWHELIFWRFVALVRIDFTSPDKFDCFQEPVL